MRLLLLEDETAIRVALSRAIQRWGHTVVSAADLAEARLRAVEHRIDGLVSDLKLPDGSGMELARELAIPFVLMSGYAAFDEAVEALRLGCVDFLTKPVALESLRRALERVGERLNGWSCCLVDADAASAEPQHLSLLRPTVAGIVRQPFCVATLCWDDAAQARAAFERSTELLPELRHRRVLAEILQCAARGQVVINSGPSWWRAAAQVDADWDDAAGRDRLQLLESLAERVIYRPDALIVECLHQPSLVSPAAAAHETSSDVRGRSPAVQEVPGHG